MSERKTVGDLVIFLSGGVNLPSVISFAENRKNNLNTSSDVAPTQIGGGHTRNEGAGIIMCRKQRTPRAKVRE